MAKPSDVPAGTRPLRLEYLPAADLAEHPSNWRLHPAEQMAALDSAIGDVGWAGALLYNERTHRLLDGHARRKLFEQRGGEVPVLIGDWDEATERKILAMLDPLGDMAEQSDDKLNELLQETEQTAAVVEATAAKLTGFQHAVVPLGSLKAHPRNYKEHPREQLEQLMRSIEEHGFYRNIVVARDNTILAGHGVWMAAKAMVPSPLRIPVVRLALDAEDPRALKLVAADNEIGGLGITDDRKLTELLHQVQEEGAELFGTGFTSDRLAALAYITRNRAEMPSMEAAAEWAAAKMPAHLPVSEDVPRMTIWFDSREDRAAFALMHTDIAISARGYSMNIWSARWHRPGVEGVKPQRSWEEIKAHVESLPPKQQEAIRLVDFEGKTIEEAAKLLGTTIGIVQGRVQRAWSTLRQRGVAPSAYTRAPVAALRFDDPDAVETK